MGGRSCVRCGSTADDASLGGGGGAVGGDAGRLAGGGSAARQATSVSAACDAVAADGRVREQGLQLAAAVESTRFGDPFDAWAAVRRGWSAARDQGRGPAEARDAALRALQARWGQARVRDVTALPEPAIVAAAGFTSPARWADSEFAHRWRGFVVECCNQLETALTDGAGGEPAGAQRLVLVTGWPLTHEGDAELAYLAQYEQHGPVVPLGGRRHGYGQEPNHAVVLAVPQFAARHADEHTRDQDGRIVTGPAIAPGASEPGEQDVLALLRHAYPYLPADAARDGAGAEVSPLVAKARAERRGARRAVRGWSQMQPGSTEVYNALVVGRYSWVPDDEPARGRQLRSSRSCRSTG